MPDSKMTNGTNGTNGIYTVNNPWGYKLNINHPYIIPFYNRFKKWKGIVGAPSDKQRFEFEAYMEKHLAKENRKK